MTFLAHVGDTVEYHGSNTDYHGLYTVEVVPGPSVWGSNETRGYVLKPVTRNGLACDDDGCFDCGSKILSAVDRSSFTVIL